MTEYTAEDFKKATVAINGERSVARRVEPCTCGHSASYDPEFPWLANKLWFSDKDLAVRGWTPIQQTEPLSSDDITQQFIDDVHQDYYWLTEDRERLDKDALRHAIFDAMDRLPQSRTFPSPDEITDEEFEDMVYRAMDEARLWCASKDITMTLMQTIITAAITQPDPRPAGAQAWEDWLISTLDHEALSYDQISSLADSIAERVQES